MDLREPVAAVRASFVQADYAGTVRRCDALAREVRAIGAAALPRKAVKQLADALLLGVAASCHWCKLGAVSLLDNGLFDCGFSLVRLALACRAFNENLLENCITYLICYAQQRPTDAAAAEKPFRRCMRLRFGVQYEHHSALQTAVRTNLQQVLSELKAAEARRDGAATRRILYGAAFLYVTREISHFAYMTLVACVLHASVEETRKASDAAYMQQQLPLLLYAQRFALHNLGLGARHELFFSNATALKSLLASDVPFYVHKTLPSLAATITKVTLQDPLHLFYKLFALDLAPRLCSATVAQDVDRLSAAVAQRASLSSDSARAVLARIHRLAYHLLVFPGWSCATAADAAQRRVAREVRNKRYSALVAEFAEALAALRAEPEAAQLLCPRKLRQLLQQVARRLAASPQLIPKNLHLLLVASYALLARSNRSAKQLDAVFAELLAALHDSPAMLGVLAALRGDECATPHLAQLLAQQLARPEVSSAPCTADSYEQLLARTNSVLDALQIDAVPYLSAREISTLNVSAAERNLARFNERAARLRGSACAVQR